MLMPRIGLFDKMLESTEIESFSTAGVSGCEIILITVKKLLLSTPAVDRVRTDGAPCSPHACVSFPKTCEMEQLKVKDVSSQWGVCAWASLWQS